MTTLRKKLMEVAVPLDAINKASAREKSIRHGQREPNRFFWLEAGSVPNYANLAAERLNEFPKMVL